MKDHKGIVRTIICPHTASLTELKVPCFTGGLTCPDVAVWCRNHPVDKQPGATPTSDSWGCDAWNSQATGASGAGGAGGAAGGGTPYCTTIGCKGYTGPGSEIDRSAGANSQMPEYVISDPCSVRVAVVSFCLLSLVCFVRVSPF